MREVACCRRPVYFRFVPPEWEPDAASVTARRTAWPSLAEAASYTVLAKYLLNNSSARRVPSSVSTTDLAFDLGSEMNL